MEETLELLTAETLEAFFHAWPPFAVELGLHEYDGGLPDTSQVGIARWVAKAHDLAFRLRGIATQPLSVDGRRDRRLLLALLDQSVFSLEVLRAHEVNPGFHAFQLNPVPYVARNYAPLEKRLEAVVKLLGAVPKYLGKARSTLRTDIPAPFVDLGLLVSRGMIESYSKELPSLAISATAVLRRNFTRVHKSAMAALEAFRVALEEEFKPRAIREFAIGSEAYSHMLRVNEGLEIDLTALEEMGMKDLERNREAFVALAKRMDPMKEPRKVMEAISTDHPTADSLIPGTAKLLEEIRQFLIDRRVITIPSEVRALVTETPPFMRGFATAAMNSPGAFEASDEAYYYVTPVDPTWPEEKQEEWLRSLNFPTLKNVSVHEAYPGHYVHFLHLRHRVQGKVPKIVTSYAFTEGWAHYCEEMALEMGYGDGDLRLRIAQLQDALLRNCRFMVSLGMHTKGMTIEDATRFIRENAFMEELPAQREAFRGSFDPGYLSYTLGKLLIKEAKERYLKAHPSASPMEFHDRLLSLGAPPVGLLPELLA